jgi:hypothetical protein
MLARIISPSPIQDARITKVNKAPTFEESSLEKETDMQRATKCV